MKLMINLFFFQVKRLLRTDNEATSVNWEVITETELNANKVGRFIVKFLFILGKGRTTFEVKKPS